MSWLEINGSNVGDHTPEALEAFRKRFDQAVMLGTGFWFDVVNTGMRTAVWVCPTSQIVLHLGVAPADSR